MGTMGGRGRARERAGGRLWRQLQTTGEIVRPESGNGRLRLFRERNLLSGTHLHRRSAVRRFERGRRQLRSGRRWTGRSRRNRRNGGGGASGATGTGGANTGSGGAAGAGGTTTGSGSAGGAGGSIGTGGNGGAGKSGTGGTGTGGSGTGGTGTGGTGTGGTGTGGTGTGGTGTGGTGTGGTGTGGTGTGGTGGCGNLIDNFEADTGYICKANGRQGYWFTYAGSMSTIYPAGAPSQPALLPTPRGTSRFAFHAFGDAVTFSGFGCYISNPPTATYDATGYTGVQFWIMGTAPAFKYIVQIPATEATVYGGTCNATTCLANTTMITNVQPSTWTLVSVPFSALGGGFAPFDITKIWSIELQAIGGTDAGAGAFDFWIDDISFY